MGIKRFLCQIGNADFAAAEERSVHQVDDGTVYFLCFLKTTKKVSIIYNTEKSGTLRRAISDSMSNGSMIALINEGKETGLVESVINCYISHHQQLISVSLCLNLAST